MKSRKNKSNELIFFYKLYGKMYLRIIVVSFISLMFNITYGQKSKIKKIRIEEIDIFNGLTSTFQDKSIPLFLSPFIMQQIDVKSLDMKYLSKEYGFDKNVILKMNSDTLLLALNDYFDILDPDSLLKYERHESELFEDPVLKYIDSQYGKLGLCQFCHIVFSKNNLYAIVEYNIHCGFLCGYGEIVLMKKEKYGWVKQESLMFMES